MTSLKMNSWGIELWDSYSALVIEVTRNEVEVSGLLSKFVKERGDIERDYAKNVSKMVKKFRNRLEVKKRDLGMETSEMEAFRYFEFAKVLIYRFYFQKIFDRIKLRRKST